MVVAVLILIVMALFSIVFWAHFIDAIRGGLVPNVATPKSALGQISELLDIKNGDLIEEIGCGDARLIRYCAAKYPQAKFTGIDNGLVNITIAKLGSLKNKNITIKYGNFTKLPKLRPSKYYLYLLPEALEIIMPKLPKGSLVVSLEYQFKGIKPNKIIKLKKQTHLAHKLYLYKL